MTPVLTLPLAALATLLLPSCKTTSTTSSSPLPPATKDDPFINSLGMKFVPVPGTNILMCTTETTVAQYQAAGLGYQTPLFDQDANHPAVNVSWNDAKAWCAWLSKKEGRTYRLPTDAEWSAAVGISTYPWGDQWPPPHNAGNYMGQEHKGSATSDAYFRSITWRGGSPELIVHRFHDNLIDGFHDKHEFTAPVGSYPANAPGIHDLGGNVWEWCEDWLDSSKLYRVLRGASWFTDYRGWIESSRRYFGAPNHRSPDHGFRCVVVR
jgi:formylglycine-generating enzyme required for sulfatase activity